MLQPGPGRLRCAAKERSVLHSPGKAKGSREMLPLSPSGFSFPPRSADRCQHGVGVPLRGSWNLVTGDPGVIRAPTTPGADDRNLRLQVLGEASLPASYSSTMKTVTIPNMPCSLSAWERMWQWNAHGPTSVASIKTSNRCPGAIFRVSQ